MENGQRIHKLWQTGGGGISKFIKLEKESKRRHDNDIF